jgi:hypothetical protein
MWRIALALTVALSAAAQTQRCESVLPVRVMGIDSQSPAEIEKHLHVFLDEHESPSSGVEYGHTKRNTFILLDASSSMKTTSFWNVTQAVARLLVTLTPDGDVKLAAFSESVSKFVGREDIDPNAPLPFPDLLRKGGKLQRTALFDAIAAAVHNPRTATPDDVVVVLTDGGDNHSSIRLNKLTQEVLRAGIRIFVVLITDRSAPDVPEVFTGREELSELLQKSGGDMLSIFPLKAGPSQVNPSSLALVQNGLATWYNAIRSAYYVHLPPLTHTTKIKVELSPKIKGARVLYPREIPGCSPRP